MKTLVVDASVGVRWQLDDEEHVEGGCYQTGFFASRGRDYGDQTSNDS